MLHIVLFGAGNQGLQQLRSLLKLQREAVISVVDPSDQALINANVTHKQYALEGKVKDLKLYHSMVDMDDEVDIAWVCTHADSKRQIIEKLLHQTLVKHLVIDPVVFQSKKDFDEVVPLIQRHKIKAWMNNPRRYHPIYDEIRKFFKADSNIEFQVHGGGWGVGARAIDFADLFSNVQKSFDWVIDTEKLGRNPKYNFRKGSMEFTGALVGKHKTMSRFNLLEYEGKSPIAVQVGDRNYRFIINETENRVLWGQGVTGFKMEPFDLSEPIGGPMSDQIAEDLINTDTCRLTSLEVIAPLHGKILEALRLHVESCLGKRYAYCPIS